MTHRLLPALLVALLATACEGQGPDSDEALSGSEALDTGATITFNASGDPVVAGTLRVGTKTDVVYDPARLTDCRGSKYGYPAWAITGYYQVGDGEVVTFTAARPDQQGNVTNKATITLPGKGDLKVWFQNNNAFGCNAWDSVYGANYHFAVQGSDREPGWVGNANYVTSRATCDGGACDADRQPLEGGFRFDTWTRQRAAITAAYFEVWKQGVTDFNNPDLWKQLDVQLYSRFVGQSAFTTQYVNFDRYVGNNARYAAPLKPLDPLTTPGGGNLTSKEQCPAITLTPTADGQYVQATLEYFFVINGVELRPAPGQLYKGVYENYRSQFAVCLTPLSGHRTATPCSGRGSPVDGAHHRLLVSAQGVLRPSDVMTSPAARFPLSAAPSMKPWKLALVCSPAK